ncbi:MAG: amino acid adenylation domain-containing protein, partial [Bryobacteraceae bacterium]
MPIETKSYRLQRWNRTETDYPRDLCIHEIFEQHAASTPAATALIFGGERWTYSQLNERANQYAHYFRALGVGADSLVALMLERSAETIAVILGVLKAGGAYAPLDINDPPTRIQALLDDLKPVTVVAERPLVESQPKHNLEKIGSPSSLAYVMFTSGSTGVPKGVMVEHRSVVRLVQNTNYADFSTNDVFLQLAPLSFDASTFEVWGALLNGASLALMPPGLVSLAGLGRAIRQHSVTTMWLTAGLFHAMADQQLESLILVKQLLAGGDVLSPVHVRKFLDAAKGTRLINGYGPTEGTTFTCCYTVPRDHPADAPIPIGTPVSNTTVYLLDKNLEPVEVGATGELYVGGDGVARGYLNMPKLTAEKFIDDPFSLKSGARMYRTGDLARYREDGIIEFLGRADSQVKLRGFRIEPGEIETVLNQHTLISQSAVVPFGENTLSKRLVAYVVPSNGHHPSPADLRVHLLDKLPPYMVPAQFVVMDSLP